MNTAHEGAERALAENTRARQFPNASNAHSQTTRARPFPNASNAHSQTARAKPFPKASNAYVTEPKRDRPSALPPHDVLQARATGQERANERSEFASTK
ncbi:hypothetical protein AKJ09_05201 [Labilithrix luteola]|uniref:Uncharacterized protein n=1 Tax=Labilithrix luteola TaxID=1391654 RepID=A0A0K1PYF7_9BACT|nr:hypothetical protein AKJ09_05201 [Labilithrix luteola]